MPETLERQTGMSTIASFYLMSKDKCEEYLHLAQLVPYSETKQARKVIIQVRRVTPSEMNSPERRKAADDARKLSNFLRTNAQEPFQYAWSGMVMHWTLAYLKTMKIDLTARTFIDAGGEWFVFDKELKDGQLKRLDQSKFEEGSLKSWYQQETNDYEFDDAGKGLADGIHIVYQYLELVDAKTVVLLHVG
jgi:hypothetical protein